MSSRGAPRPRTPGCSRLRQRPEFAGQPIASKHDRVLRRHGPIDGRHDPRSPSCRLARRSGHLIAAGTRAAPFRPLQAPDQPSGWLPLAEAEQSPPLRSAPSRSSANLKGRFSVCESGPRWTGPVPVSHYHFRSSMRGGCVCASAGRGTPPHCASARTHELRIKLCASALDREPQAHAARLSGDAQPNDPPGSTGTAPSAASPDPGSSQLA